MSHSWLYVCLATLMVASFVEGTYHYFIPYKSLPSAQQFYYNKDLMGILKTMRASSFQPGKTTVEKKDEVYSLVSSQRSYYYPNGPSGPIPPFEYLENFERPPVDIYDQQYGAAAPGFGGILFG